jgi:hypothetical protein
MFISLKLQRFLIFFLVDKLELSCKWADMEAGVKTSMINPVSSASVVLPVVLLQNAAQSKPQQASFSASQDTVHLSLTCPVFLYQS